jgi:hypothetical protein
MRTRLDRTENRRICELLIYPGRRHHRVLERCESTGGMRGRNRNVKNLGGCGIVGAGLDAGRNDMDEL